MKRILPLILLFAIPLFCAAQAADQAGSPSQQGPRGDRSIGERSGARVGGTITAIGADSITVNSMQGKTVTIKIGSDTRLMKDRQPAKLSDFKVGDMIMAGGDPAGENVINARMVALRGEMARMREGLGKEFIAGEVKAVDGTKLTIARPDGQSQTIEVDENTSFRKGRESITLPDIKVGDHVMGPGKLNSAGVFVPQTLNVGGPAGRGMGWGERGGERRQPQPPQPREQQQPPQ
ncbi:MAG: DUF5666 domain-containing protein [Terriglobales bacterium]